MGQEERLLELVRQPIISPVDAEALQKQVDLAAPTPEQIQAADAMFAQQQREADQVAGYLGMWSGAMVLNELIEPVVRTKEENEKMEEDLKEE